MKLLLAFSLLIVTINAAPRKVVLQEWKSFKDTYGKVYTDENEDLSRLKIYWNNKRIIQHHNKSFNKGKVSFDVSVNYFSDLTTDELAALRGYKQCGTINRNENFRSISDELPAYVDWREKNAVTPIKNQRSCGSCYAFASIAGLESHYYIATGITTDLSEQNVLDCAWPYGPCGCDGGWMHPVFDYIRDNGGIDSEESYPYQKRDCHYCRYKPKYNTTTCSGYIDLPEGNEDAVKSTVALIGPVVVAIDANARSFDFYKSGIYYEPCCRSYWSDHAVLVIGYGTSSDGIDYWIIKNSWGTKWGEDGYMKMTRNLNNHCAVSTWAGYPIL